VHSTSRNNLKLKKNKTNLYTISHTFPITQKPTNYTDHVTSELSSIRLGLIYDV